MKYISPFQTFGINPQEFAAQWPSIKKETQRYLQSYSLYADVNIKQTTATKQQFNKWMDELDAEQSREIHLQIYENVDLCRFLQAGELHLFANNSLSSAPTAVIEYIKPFYLHQYADAWVRALQTNNEHELNLLKTQVIPYPLADILAYAQPIEDYLKKTIANLEALANSPQLSYISERELLSYLPDQTIATYNFLPDFLSNARNWLATAVGRLAMYMSVQLGRTDGAMIMIQQALKLNVDNDLKSDLQKLMVRHKKIGRPAAWIIVTISVIALLFLIQYIEKTYF